MVLVESLNNIEIYVATYEDTATIIDNLLSVVIDKRDPASEKARLTRILKAYVREAIKINTAFLVYVDGHLKGTFVLEDRKRSTILYINLKNCDEYTTGFVFNYILNVEFAEEDVYFYDDTESFLSIGTEIVEGYYKVKNKVASTMKKLYKSK